MGRGDLDLACLSHRQWGPRKGREEHLVALFCRFQKSPTKA